jgi:hypothetical protein
VAEVAPGALRAVGGLATAALTGIGGALIGQMFAPFLGAIAGGIAGATGGYKAGAGATDALWDKVVDLFGSKENAEQAAMVHAQAAAAGEKSFEFGGKKYPVTLKPQDAQKLNLEGVAEGMFGIDSKTKGAIQNVVAKLSDIPGMWDHAAQTFTDEGMDKLKTVLKNNPKHIKYAVNLTADDFEADESIEETIRKVKGGYRLYSKDGKKNLGTFDTRAGAEKHEREVQYFKHKG